MNHRIRIFVNALGTGTVLLDGQDISDLVTAIGFNTDIGKPNEVTLVMSNLDIEVAADMDDINLVERKLVEEGK